MKKNNNEQGFSLVELLVVVIIIAIVAAIAIPNLLASRRAANDAQAVSNLRILSSANVAYFSAVGNNTAYASDFVGLNTAALVDTGWTASPVTRGVFTYTYTAASGNSGFCITAVPGTGQANYAFAVSHLGAIYRAAGVTAPTCNAASGAITGGSLVQ